jgi:predicted DNA binding CopG/RHH family protein
LHGKFLTLTLLSYDNLQLMQQPNSTAPSPTSASFAGLLAALATPVPDESASSSGRRSAAAWNDDDLADDVATLSYERALQNHARYRPAGLPYQSLTDQSLTDVAASGRYNVAETVQQPGTTQAATPKSVEEPEPALCAEAEPSRFSAMHFEKTLKQASVTIRMSKTECEQLHRRAAEAGVTVSAYLRSCTFEAESLRAMVKDTLAQLRTATAPTEPQRRFWLRGLAGWLARLLTPWQGNRRVARA